MAQSTGLYAGIAGPALFFLLLGLAILSFPGYDLSVNYLSDLGVQSESGWYFNTALVFSGALGFVFAYSMRNRLRKTGPMLLMTGSLFLMLVAIFTSKSQPMHTAFAGIFFITTTAGLGLIANELRDKTHVRTALAFAAVCSFIFVLTQNQILEHLAVVTINISLVVLAVYFLKQK